MASSGSCGGGERRRRRRDELILLRWALGAACEWGFFFFGISIIMMKQSHFLAKKKVI
jgi:hypothetical protein